MLETTQKPRSHVARWILLGLWCLGGLWFYLLESLVKVPQYYMYAKLDDYIPFLPVFVIPYCVWYLYLAVPAAYLFFKKPDIFCRFGVFMVSSMMIACCVYTLLPNGHSLRPTQLGDGPFNAIIGFLYRIDTPTNSAPSLHVADAMGAHGAIVALFAAHPRRRAVEATSLVTMVLIILSTVFIKQHSVIDLLTGMLLGLTLYYIVYGRARTSFAGERRYRWRSNPSV